MGFGSQLTIHASKIIGRRWPTIFYHKSILVGSKETQRIAVFDIPEEILNQD